MRSGTESLISKALFEVIDSVVAPSLRESLIDEALAAFAPEQNWTEIPVDPNKLNEFVHGPLREALVRAVGCESVETLTSDLERVVQLAGGFPSANSETPQTPLKGLRPPRRRSRPRFQSVTPQQRPLVPDTAPPRASSRTPKTPRFATFHPSRSDVPVVRRPRPDMSVPPISSGPFPSGTAEALSMAGVRSHPAQGLTITPLVVVASKRPDLARRLAKSLENYVDLMSVHSVVDIVREVGKESGSRVVVLVDCHAPSVRPQAIAALADDLPSNVRVILWGATKELREMLVFISPRCQTWIGIDLHTDVDGIADRCANLVC